MSTGLFVLIGIFVMAAGFALWNARLRRGVEQRLRALGFEPCDADAPALERAWLALARDGAEHTSAAARRASPCCRTTATWTHSSPTSPSGAEPGAHATA